MRVKHLLFFSLLSLLTLTGCGTSKSTSKTISDKEIIKIIRDTIIVNPKNEEVQMTRAAKLNNYKINGDNYPSKSQDERVRFLVLHYTALDYPTSLRALTQRDVSSHYLINDINDDKIDLLVDETKRAWHAGVSKWKNIDNLNFTSIGIEIVNKGYEVIDSTMVHFPYPEYQFRKIGELSKDIVNRYNISPINVVGHSDIAPLRKQDPGPLFPWKRLYDEYGVGAWYDEIDKQSFIPLAPFIFDDVLVIKDVQNNLKKYGYDIQITGEWDLQTKKILQAFQYHFNPKRNDGLIDVETWAILKALNKKYNP